MAGHRISVVLVSYFTGPVLFEAVGSALSQDGLDQLVLVDNGNSPAVVDKLSKVAARDPRILLLTGHGNVGYAASANLGASYAACNYVLFMNPDCILPPGALSRFREVAGGRAGPFAIGARVANPDGSEQRGSRRIALTPRTAVVESLRLDRFVPAWLNLPRLNTIDQPVPDAPQEIPVVSGTCIFVSADGFRAMGGFDERYFLHVDDLDFCLQVGRRGGEVVWVPDITVTHYGGTSAASPLVVEWHKARGFAKYFRKNFSGSHNALLIAAISALGYLRYLGKAPALCLQTVSRGVRRDHARNVLRSQEPRSTFQRRRLGARGRAAPRLRNGSPGRELAPSRLR
jgi:GT2 family glycosyltransferase